MIAMTNLQANDETGELMFNYGAKMWLGLCFVLTPKISE